MVFWIKASLWLGVALLPGGVLLLPVIYAVHRREQPAGGDSETTASETAASETVTS